MMSSLTKLHPVHLLPTFTLLYFFSTFSPLPRRPPPRRKMMLIIARPARLLECLEFDPEDFYNQMVDMEGEVRTMQMIRRMNQYGQQQPPQQEAQQQQQPMEPPALSVQDTGELLPCHVCALIR